MVARASRATSRGSFYEIQRVIDLLVLVVGDACRVFRLIENVASMDDASMEAMSKELRLAPVLIEAGQISHASRDRVYWVDQQFMVPWQGGSVNPERGGVRVSLREGPGPQDRWLRPGHEWPAGVGGSSRLPTFLRCVPRRAPGSAPTGLRGCDEATLQR